MTFNIKRKLISLAILSITLVTIIGGTGHWGLQQLDSTMHGIVDRSAHIRNHLTADMMHDALKSDVLAALLASKNGHTEKIADIENDYNQHARTFSESLKSNQELIQTGEISRVLQKTMPKLQEYISTAGNIIRLASQDPQAANAELEHFNIAFDIIATEMKFLTNLIEEETWMMQRAGDADVALSNNITLFIIFAGIAILGVTSWWIYVYITQPLNKLVIESDKIALGNLTLNTNHERSDEIRQLADATEKMRGRYLNMIFQITSTTNQLSVAAEEINEMIVQLQSGSKMAGDTITTISTAVAQINDMSMQIASAVEQQGDVAEVINSYIFRINDMPNHAADGAAQTSEATDDLAR